MSCCKCLNKKNEKYERCLGQNRRCHPKASWARILPANHFFWWSQHHNKFSWELITTFFLAAILRHEFLMFEHNQEKNKDALGCSGCAPGGWPSSCKKITYIRLQNAECLRAVPTFQSYWCSLDMYWQAELKECEDASVTLLEGFFLTTASIGKNIKIDSWRLKKAWWCQDRNDFHNWNMGLSKVGNSIYHHDEIQVKHRSVWKISWFSKSSKKMKLKVAYQENNNNNQAVQTLSCWHERFQLGVFSSCKFA